MKHNEKTVAYFEWLRLFAAAAVVLMHTAASRWSSISHETGAWLVLTAWDSLVRWPVPIFIMITGAIFLPRKTELKTVLTRYIPRMVLAFVIWSGICALYGLYRGAGWQQTVLNFVTGHYHLWYLPYLCGVYLTLPFLQRIVSDEKLERQLLGVSLAVGVAVPWLADAAALVLPGWSGVIRSLQNSLNFTFFMDLLGLLLLGHWLNRHDLSRRTRGWIYALGIASLSLTAIATVWATRRAGFQSSLFFDMKSPLCLMAAVALFVFAKHRLTRLPGAVAFLARCSFGVYLSHALVIDVLADLGIHVLAWSPVFSVPLLAAAVFAISLIPGIATAACRR